MSAEIEAGAVYAATTVHVAADAHAAEAPFQIALVDLDGGSRRLVRIQGPKVAIGDRVTSAAASGRFRREE